MLLILSGVSAVILSGCGAGTQDTGVSNAEVWNTSQKREFLAILETDKYLSLCNQQALYDKVKENQDSTLMTKLLVEYTDNLANGCIDLKSFNSAQ